MAESARRSAPVAVDENPAAGAAIVVGGNPFGVTARPLDEMALDPDVLAAVPTLVSRLPDFTFRPLARQDGDDFVAQRRWLARNDDLVGKGRHRNRTQAGDECQTAEHAATGEILHGTPPGWTERERFRAHRVPG